MTAAGPTAIAERALGLDLARGLMLLLIALANAHYFLEAPSYLGGYPHDVGALDRFVTWLLTTFVDGRAYPLFGLLLGYGVVQVTRRNEWRGRRGVRRLLRRRGAVLLAIGALHGLLLYAGDIIAAYGVLLLVFATAAYWRDRWVLLWPAVSLLMLVAAVAFVSADSATDGPYLADLPRSIDDALRERPIHVALNVLFSPFGAAAMFLTGVWAGRRRLLDGPGRLAAVATSGITISVLGAQPFALTLADVSPVSDGGYNLAAAVHVATGMAGGVGYAAAFVVLAPRLGRGAVVRALVATGQRSMTAYIAQSVVWTIVFTPFLLGLSDDLGVASTALLAACTWAATALLCSWMDRRGWRGPFEVLVRRATYGRT